jgi:hypothetical protein
MNAGDLKKHLLQTRSSRLWLAGLAAAAAFGLALLLAPSESQHRPSPAALQRTASSSAPGPSLVEDPAWGKLSAIEQRTLEPLKSTWSTLTAEQQDKWRLIVDRFQAKPRHVQRRLAARIAEWARFTPEQRAHARLNFLEVAKHYNRRQRKQQWLAFQNSKPIEGHAITGGALPRVVPPAFVQASPGATTVLLSQLYELPSPEEAAERDKVAQDPRPIDEAVAESVGAASAAAGSGAALERPSP